MIKTVMILVAILALAFLPMTAQDVVYHHGNGNGHGGGGNGGGNGGGGNGGGGNGGGNGGGHNLLDGTPFSFEGTVITAGENGNGMEVSTASGNSIVSGLGPLRYWDSLDMTKPIVGDSVSGNGYTVDYNDVTKNILTDITLNGTQVQLRDEEGKPLWRGRGNGNHGPGQGGNRDFTDILEGTPFTYEGDIISIGISTEGMRGNGIVIATATGNVEIRGLGPARYWEHEGVERPVEGDTITVNGYAVDFDGTVVNIVMSATVDGVTIQLRDPETGAPLWRRPKGKKE